MNKRQMTAMKARLKALKKEYKVKSKALRENEAKLDAVVHEWELAVLAKTEEEGNSRKEIIELLELKERIKKRRGK